MNNDELAEHLNAVVGLTGRNVVTVNVIRQWVAWDVLPKATPKGRTIGQSVKWSRSGNDVRRALRLAELRKWDVKRETAVIVQTYIEWGHPDFDRVRDALVREVIKGRGQLVRRQTTLVRKTNYRELSASKQRAIATQIGPLDSQFVQTQFQQSPELYATFAEAGRFGDGNSEQLQRLILEALERMMPGAGEFIPDDIIASLSNSISGMIGMPDEIDNSAQSEIERASEREFRIARHITRRLLWWSLREAGRIMAIKELPYAHYELLQMRNSLSSQISVGVWASFQFAQCLLCVRRSQKIAGKRELIKPI